MGDRRIDWTKDILNKRGADFDEATLCVTVFRFQFHNAEFLADKAFGYTVRRAGTIFPHHLGLGDKIWIDGLLKPWPHLDV